MNESIAKQANREDDCTGRFWEGRFRSQALLDEGALLTCMVYVDLNPIRAGIAETPEDSDFTSVQERIVQYWQRTRQKPKKVAQWKQQNEASSGQGLMQLATTDFEHPDRLPFSREEYLELVEWTGKQWRQGKQGKIPDRLQPILKRLDLNEAHWLESLKQFRHRFFHAVGKGPRLSDFAQKLQRQHWLRGKQAAARMYRTAA